MYHYLWLDYFFSIHYKYVLINKNLILIIFVFLLNIFLSRDSSSFICVFRNSTFRLKRQRNKMKDKKQAVINWTIFICILGGNGSYFHSWAFRKIEMYFYDKAAILLFDTSQYYWLFFDLQDFSLNNP